MATKSPESLFRRLTRLFRSGPVVRRKIRNLDTAIAVPDKTKSSGALLFQKSLAPTYATITANAYNLSERLMRYQDFAEMEYCVSFETLIAVPGGFEQIGKLAKRCDNDPEYTFIVYSYDHEKKQIVPALGKQARQTRVDHAWKVTFDSGKEIIGTANHRLMLRDGTYCKIEDLKQGMAMMPFYRKDLCDVDNPNSSGYRWIYTISAGWVPEHRLVASWVANRNLEKNEVVHHKNFVKHDNRPENLEIMLDRDHLAYHATVLNGQKWSSENADWIEKFKVQHVAWMKQNNPATRHDITFGRILETCERVGFNVRALCDALDTDLNVVKRRLRANGFQDFQTFAIAYQPTWRNNGWQNDGEKNPREKNPRYDHTLTFNKICDAYKPGLKKQELCDILNTTQSKLWNRLQEHGFKTYTQFAQSYQNHRVVSVEYYGEIPLYDLTVDGYKNFATDSVVSHNTPELAAALDIYADETVAVDDKNRSLHVYSENEKIKQILEELFYNTLNVEFNLRTWVRNLCKYGDFFLYNDVSPEHGVINAFPIPVNEIEREENFDREDPFAIRYRWVTLGNRTLENWEVSHFRLLGNDMFLPYGSSIIEPARRIWRQLILIEDAMLVYRVVRAPERRVFYIDVANIPAESVPTYVEEQRRNLRTNQVIDKNSGRVDLRYNPLSIDEDYFIPVRGAETGTKIDTLAGGQNTAAVEDVAYIQKKLFAALKIPRAYLGYDDMLSSKATLAQEDIRFSRTINVIQKTIIAELNKLAIIHLYANGFTDDDLVNFTLRLSNPSTVAQQQKLELWRAKFEIAGSVPEGMGSQAFVYKNIWGLNDNEINDIEKERFREKIVAARIEAAGGEGGEGGEGGGGLFGGGEEAGGEEAGGGGEETPPEETAGEEPKEDEEPGTELLTSGEGALDEDDEPFVGPKAEGDDPPIRPSGQLKKALYYRGRRRTHGASKTHEPDFAKMTSNDNPAMQDPYDMDWIKSVISNPFGESIGSTEERPRLSLPPDIVSVLRKMSVKFGVEHKPLLAEGEEPFGTGVDDSFSDSFAEHTDPLLGEGVDIVEDEGVEEIDE